MNQIVCPILLALCAFGCAESSSSRSLSRSSSPLTGSPPGLVVEQWRYQGEDGRLDVVISELLPDESQTIHGEEDFRRDGFRAVVLDAQGAQQLQATLDLDSPARRIQHGEAVAWRDLLTRTIDRNTVVLENGRAQRLPQSIMGLAARGWSIPTVNGSAVHVQIVPHIIPERTSISPNVRPGELRGQALSSTIETTLDEDTILVVTSAPALVKDEAQEQERNVSFLPSTGPNAPLPPTVAELLLDGNNGSIRGVLLIRGTPNPAYRPQAKNTP